MIKQSISALLLLAFAFIHSTQRAMDYNDVGDHIYSTNVRFETNQELADFLTEKCRCPEDINTEFFQHQYPQRWNTIQSWDLKTKNKLLKKVLGKTNDSYYRAMRGAIAFLVSAGCHVDTTNKLFKTSALQRAIQYDDYNMAQFLLSHHANPHTINHISPIFFRIKTLKMAKLLGSFNTDFTLKDENEFSVLHDVVSTHCTEPELITFYCAHGVNVNDVDKRGHTALHELAYANVLNYFKPQNILLKQIQLLIDAGISQKFQWDVIQKLSNSTATPDQLIKNYLEKNLTDAQ